MKSGSKEKIMSNIQTSILDVEDRQGLLDKILEYHDYAKRVTNEYYKFAKRWTFYKSCFLFFMVSCLVMGTFLALTTEWGWTVLLGAVAANFFGNSYFGAKVASGWSLGGMWGGVQYYLEFIANEVHESEPQDSDEREEMRCELRCMVRQMRELKDSVASWRNLAEGVNVNRIQVPSLKRFPGGRDAEWKF